MDNQDMIFEQSDLGTQMDNIRQGLKKYSDDLTVLLSKTPDEIIGGHAHKHESFESLEQKRDDVLDGKSKQMRRIDRNFSSHEDDQGAMWEIDFDPSNRVGRKESRNGGSKREEGESKRSRVNFTSTNPLSASWDEDMFQLLSQNECCIRSDRNGVCRITSPTAGSTGILAVTDTWNLRFGENTYG